MDKYSAKNKITTLGVKSLTLHPWISLKSFYFGKLLSYQAHNKLGSTGAKLLAKTIMPVL